MVLPVVSVASAYEHAPCQTVICVCSCPHVCSAFQEVYSDLLKASKHGKGVAVKVAAVEAAAICCFVSAEDEHTTLGVMEDLQKLWKKGSLLGWDVGLLKGLSSMGQLFGRQQIAAGDTLAVMSDSVSSMLWVLSALLDNLCNCSSG